MLTKLEQAGLVENIFNICSPRRREMLSDFDRWLGHYVVDERPPCTSHMGVRERGASRSCS